LTDERIWLTGISFSLLTTIELFAFKVSNCSCLVADQTLSRLDDRFAMSVDAFVRLDALTLLMVVAVMFFYNDVAEDI
jgi:hypothetical protein